MIKIGMASLGCPKNQVDAEIMLAKLKDKGYEITPYEQEAQVIIVNTCGFIESAKQESIDTILDLSGLKKEGNLKCLIVTGCLAERYREPVKEQIPEIDTVVKHGRKRRDSRHNRAGSFGRNRRPLRRKGTAPSLRGQGAYKRALLCLH